MSNRRIQIGVFLVGLFLAAFPPPAHAVWNVGGQFKVGGQLKAITPTATSFPDATVIDPTCGAQGGTSMAIAQGSKLAAAHGVDPGANPIVLVVSCLDNNDTTKRAQLYFLNPANGNVVKSIQTNTTASPTLPFAPNNGWAHLVLRPDQGDLLGCGNDGTIYRIDFSQFNNIPDGTATSVNRPSGLPTNCAALAWDPEERKIYQGVSGGNNTVGVHVFQDTSSPTAIPADLAFFNLPNCTPSGIAITGGLVLVACKTTSTILRLDKGDPQVGRVGGTILGVNGTLGVLGLPAGSNLSPGLGDLACDPVTFNRDPVTFNPKDTFTDGLWSRLGTNGNGVVALEFPAFTCGLPSKSVVVDATLGPLSPLAPGLSAPAAGQAGAIPLATCFDTSGKVVDSDGDGLPDCWETSGINFAGDGNSSNVFSLCVQGDTNPDGVPACASPNHKDLFVEVNWMVNHKPDPLALNQTQAATSVGVQSVRGAFVAAPVSNPDATAGIRIHFQVKPSAVTLTSLEPGATTLQKEVSELVFTPCTPPAQNPNGTLNVKSLSDAADFDAIRKLNFGTATEQANQNILNAKRLAFRYVLFAHNQTGANGGGSSASGCSELGGDDAAVTLASFTTTTVSSCTSPDCTQATHNRGSTDQQAGTFMHEFGHTLGLRHGGGDNINCKPNYLSVMSYTRQIAGSPIPGRRLDYSRAELPAIALNEGSLNEPIGLCTTTSLSSCDPSLLPISTFFPSADQTTYGPTAWSVVAATGMGSACPTSDPTCINWNKDKTNKGVPIIETTTQSGNINQGSSGGCDGSGTVLTGHDDWHTLLYRASATLDFAGGVHSATKQEHTSLTKENATALFLAADLDDNGVGDAQDCGTAPAGATTSDVGPNATSVPIGVDPTTLGFSPTGSGFLGSTLDEFTYTGTDSVGFTGVSGIDATWPAKTTTVLATLLCPRHQVSLGPPPEPTCVAPDGTRSFCPTHRIDIKPSAPADSTGAKTISLGTESTVTIAIFAEPNPTEPNPTTQFPVVGNGLWDPTTELVTICLATQPRPADCLRFNVESLQLFVKTNKNGQGTCSPRDVADPVTGVKDGFADMLCQFATTGLPLGRHEGIVSGFFIDPVTGLETAFRARQEFIVVK